MVTTILEQELRCKSSNFNFYSADICCVHILEFNGIIISDQFSHTQLYERIGMLNLIIISQYRITKKNYRFFLWLNVI